MSWYHYYKLLEKYDGDLSKATEKEMEWAAYCNPATPHDARALAEKKYQESNSNKSSSPNLL